MIGKNAIAICEPAAKFGPLAVAVMQFALWQRELTIGKGQRESRWTESEIRAHSTAACIEKLASSLCFGRSTAARTLLTKKRTEC